MGVDFDLEDVVAILTLDRPEKLNALSFDLVGDLQAALDRCEQDAAVRAVVLTGAGERAFSAGADIEDLARSVEGGPDQALREIVGRGQGLTRRIENFPKPVIAAVNGLALGGGCEIVEATHMAVAADHAAFGKPEISLGFVPPFGGSQRLPRHVGRKRGLELILTGDPISARRALEIGLINRVVPAAELRAEACALARRIARHEPPAVAACLAAVTRGINLPIDEGLAVEASWFASCVATGTAAEGLQAFLTRPRDESMRHER